MLLTCQFNGGYSLSASLLGQWHEGGVPQSFGIAYIEMTGNTSGEKPIGS